MAHVLNDTWKLDRIKESAFATGVQIDWLRSIWPGVICKEHPEIVQRSVEKGYILDPRGRGLGDVGAALAHITLWEQIARQVGPSDIVLAMEDNALFTTESLNGTCSAIAAVGDFDYLALTVLRPRGTRVDDDLGIREVRKGWVGEPLPNVWMSSYLVTGAGAAKLLKCLKANPHNFAQNIIDHVVSKQCLSGDEGIRAFVVDHHRFFGHEETGGDSRKKFNLDAALHPKSLSLMW